MAEPSFALLDIVQFIVECKISAVHYCKISNMQMAKTYFILSWLLFVKALICRWLNPLLHYRIFYNSLWNVKSLLCTIVKALICRWPKPLLHKTVLQCAVFGASAHHVP